MASCYLVSHVFFVCFFCPSILKSFLLSFHCDMSTFGFICVNPAFYSEQIFNLRTYVSFQSWKCSTFISEILLVHSPMCLSSALSDNSLHYGYPPGHFLWVSYYTVCTLPSEFISITTYLIFTISNFLIVYCYFNFCPIFSCNFCPFYYVFFLTADPGPLMSDCL